MNSPEVSVLVPVYNVEKYLNKCLDSILCQTFTNFELILVDDGSQDKSSIICDEYALKDTRISVIHKENGGLTSARNAALKVARGNYILIFDSDDWADNNHIEQIYSTAINNNADLVLCDYYCNSISKEHYCSNAPSTLEKNQIICDALSGKIHAGLWCKLFKRSIFSDNNIIFPKYSYYEDMYILISVLQYATNVVYSPIATYHYRFNPMSLTNDKNPQKRIKMFLECIDNLNELDVKYQLRTNENIGDSLNNCIFHNEKHLLLKCYTYPELLKVSLSKVSVKIKLKQVRNFSDFCLFLAIRKNIFFQYFIFDIFIAFKKFVKSIVNNTINILNVEK